MPGRPDATARAVEGVRVRAGADTPADLAIIEGRPLRGVVVDRETGGPVPGTWSAATARHDLDPAPTS